MPMAIRYLCSTLGLAATLVFLSDLLPNRLNRRKIALISLGLSLLAAPKYLFPWPEGSAAFLNGIVLTVYIAGLFLPFHGPRLRRIALLAYFSCLFFFSHAAGAMLLTWRYGATAEAGFAALSAPVPLLVQGTFTIAAYILLGALSIILGRMIMEGKLQAFFLLFFILPIGQMVMIYSFTFAAWTAFWILGVLLSLLADLVLLAYTISQEKKTALEEKLRETRHQLALEQTHYQAVAQHREELLQIRQDFNAQLTAVAQLVRAGAEGPARDLILSLSDEINKTKENPYCAIPVVNAILTEKAQECAAAGINLEVELDVPSRLRVEQMHLCSVFSNLLDNAIQACRQIQGEQAFIRLSSKVAGDYLFIKVLNTSLAPPKKPRPGRGYGSRILADLAAQYDGNYQGEYRDGRFTAVASFLAVEQ